MVNLGLIVRVYFRMDEIEALNGKLIFSYLPGLS